MLPQNVSLIPQITKIISPQMQQLFPTDATHNWPDEERWSEAETFSVQKQQSTPQGEHLNKIMKIMPLVMFPQGMYINHDDLVTLATGPPGQGEAILQGLDRSRFLLFAIIISNFDPHHSCSPSLTGR